LSISNTVPTFALRKGASVSACIDQKQVPGLANAESKFQNLQFQEQVIGLDFGLKSAGI
jgi:hypothetical protein